MRLIGRILGGVVALVLLAVGAVYGITTAKMRRTYTVSASPLTIPSDSASLARGRHLATAIGKCVECHGDNLAGKDFIDGGPLGHLYALNLTRGKGGVGGTLTDAQWVAAIRHGIRHDGRSLWFMPSDEYQHLTDADLGALVAYLKSLPPVDNELPNSHIGPLGRTLYLAGKFPFLAAENVDHELRAPAELQLEVTPAYGKYLANVGGCTGCHGPGLSGGKIPGTPPDWKPAANLTPTGIGRYTEADFFRALREGKRPDGTQLDSIMPYRLTRNMQDDEIRAVYAYLKTVPPKAFGER